MLETILNSVKNIEGDLMTNSKSKAAGGGFVDPVSNFPTLTPKHNSLAANVLLNRPDLYTKYCNSVTSSGFTFDNAIQVGFLCLVDVCVPRLTPSLARGSFRVPGFPSTSVPHGLPTELRACYSANPLALLPVRGESFPGR